MWSGNRGGLLIEVVARVGLTVVSLAKNVFVDFVYFQTFDLLHR